MFPQPPRFRDGLRRLFSYLPVQMAVYLLVAMITVGFGFVRLWDVFSVLPEGGAPPWWAMAVPFVSCPIVLLKRRAPLPGLVAAVLLFVTDLLLLGSIVTLIMMLEMLHAYTVTLSDEGRRRVLTCTVVATALVTAAGYAVTGEAQVAAMMLLQFGALLGFSFWYANSIAQSQEMVELYRQRAEDTARLAALDRDAAVRGERERMARELHDVVAGHVAAVAIRSEAALASAAGADAGTGGARPESLERSALRAVRDASLAAHGELRTMISVLRDDLPGRADGFVPSLGRSSVQKLVEEANRSGLEAVYRDELEGPVATTTDHAIGRIVQESLANAAKHASGAHVDVRLSGDERTVRVEVLSRGGSALERLGLPGNGLGLEMLAERAGAVGGRLAVGPEPDPADPSAPIWAVRAELPRGEADPVLQGGPGRVGRGADD